MQTDIVTVIISLSLTNLLFSLQIAPWVVIIVTALRTVILLSGRKREFEDWTRNPLLAFLSILFFPGAMITTSIRYLVTKASGVDVQSLKQESTYGEFNMYITVDRMPRPLLLMVSLFISVVLSIFVAFTLIVVPIYLVAESMYVLLSWYLALAVLFHTSIKSGDISLLGASLKKYPKTGPFELLGVLVGLVLLYTQVMGVVI